MPEFELPSVLCIDEFTGKRTLLASNLVPEIVTIMEMSYGLRWCLIAAFHHISTMIVLPAISVL